MFHWDCPCQVQIMNYGYLLITTLKQEVQRNRISSKLYYSHYHFRNTKYVHVDFENGWITCPGIKKDSWGQKDHKYFLVFSIFLVRQYTKWRMLSALTLGRVRKGEQEGLLHSLVPLSM